MKRRPSHLPIRACAALLTMYGWLCTSGFASETSPTASYFRTVQSHLLDLWCPPNSDRALLSIQLDSPGPAPFLALPAELNVRFVVRKSGGYRCEVSCSPSRE